MVSLPHSITTAAEGAMEPLSPEVGVIVTMAKASTFGAEVTEQPNELVTVTV